MIHVPAASSRVVAFGAISVALHACLLSGYGPGTHTRLPDGEAGRPAALYARLVPPPTGEAVPKGAVRNDTVWDAAAHRDTARDHATGNSEVKSVQGAGHHAPSRIPLPDEWFAAEELSVRAEPLTEVQIRYPPELAGSGMVGAARVLLHIDERGFVRKARVEASLPHTAFGEAALSAWTDVRFSPALKDGVAVKSRKLLEVSFLP